MSSAPSMIGFQETLPAELFPALIAAIVISLLGGVLSIFVVLKRLAFIGQGVSHAAFGGVGIALLLGLHGATTASHIGQLLVVVAFSILAALWIASVSRDQNGRIDTAIGVVLSASMALGFMLFTLVESSHDHDDHGHAAHGHEDQHHVLEEILFGNILDTSWAQTWIGIAATTVIVGVVWLMRRSLMFWAFDDQACDSFGVRSKLTTNIFMILLSLAVVLSMQIAGVVLAAAVLVLPGAAALNLSYKLHTTFFLAILISVVGACAGFFVGVSAGYPVGPSIVLVESVVYGFTLGAKLILTKRSF